MGYNLITVLIVCHQPHRCGWTNPPFEKICASQNGWTSSRKFSGWTSKIVELPPPPSVILLAHSNKWETASLATSLFRSGCLNPQIQAGISPYQGQRVDGSHDGSVGSKMASLQIHLPDPYAIICSMVWIFLTYIYHKFRSNVGKYTIFLSIWW